MEVANASQTPNLFSQVFIHSLPVKKRTKKKKKRRPNYQKGEKKKDAHHALSMNLKKALSHTTKYASIKEFFLFFFLFCVLFFSWENDIDDQKNEKESII